jgi:hypothetical protein
MLNYCTSNAIYTKYKSLHGLNTLLPWELLLQQILNCNLLLNKYSDSAYQLALLTFPIRPRMVNVQHHSKITCLDLLNVLEI